MAYDSITKQIPLTQGKFAIVDAADYDWLNQWKWHFRNGYALRAGKVVNGIRSKAIFMHRLIVETPEGMETDHINGNRSDNRRLNLRIATTSQNAMNQKPQDGCRSRFKGVDWIKKTNKWRSRIVINRKRKHLGYFHNEVEAAEAYNKAAEKLHGEYARKNVVA